MDRRNFLAAVAASAAGAAVLVLPGQTKALSSVPVTESKQIIRATCIRLGPGGPYIHTNSMHGNRGVRKVGMNSAGDLVVYTDWASDHSEQLLYAAATIDFQLGAKGVTCGVSGGGPTSTIRLVDGKGIRRRANSSFWNPKVDNIWFMTISEISD